MAMSLGSVLFLSSQALARGPSLAFSGYIQPLAAPQVPLGPTHLLSFDVLTLHLK